MVIHLLLGAKRLTTSGCSRQALRQTRLPPDLLLIRTALGAQASRKDCTMAATMDEVLDILHRTGPEFGGGLANHGPMAAEAMLALGRPDAVLPWVERYKRRLQDRPAQSHPISPEAWREALGNINRVGDWVAFFDHQLVEASWQDVVRSWVPRLSPALIAAATHGLIRTSHAVRSLAASETPQRLHELAEGLGFWAARYRVLPGTPSAGTAGYTPGEALARVQRVHGAEL